MKAVKEIDSKQGRIFTMAGIGDRIIGTASQTGSKIWDAEVFIFSDI